jgi:hypothetical protein
MKTPGNRWLGTAVIISGIAGLIISGCSPKVSLESHAAITNSVPAPPPFPTALKTPIQCAYYIKEVETSVSSEGSTPRHILPALAATLFISDYIMAAQADTNHLPLTKAAIIEAFQSTPFQPSFIIDRLSSYSRFSGTLSEHYESAKRVGDSVQNVEAVLRDAGLQVDYKSDLLMDCLRLAGLQTHVEDAYGARSEEYPTFADVATACHQSFGRVFEYRFKTRYGMSEQTASNLVEKVSIVTITNLSPAAFEMPALLN